MANKLQLFYLFCIIVTSITLGLFIDPIHHNFSYLSHIGLQNLLILYHFLCGIYLLIYTKKWMNVLHSPKSFHIIASILFVLFITSSLIPYQDNFSILSKWHTRISLFAFILYILFFITLFYQSYLKHNLTIKHIQMLSTIVSISILLYFISNHISYILEAFLMIAICTMLYQLRK